MVDLEQIGKKVECLSSITNLFFKTAMAIGFLIIFGYYNSLGFFPRDLSFGDGALLVLISFIFGVLYFFVLCSFICLGHVLSIPIIKALPAINMAINFYKIARNQNPKYIKSTVKNIAMSEYAFAFWGGVILLLHVKNTGLFFETFITAIACAVTWRKLNDTFKKRVLIRGKEQALLTKREIKYCEETKWTPVVCISFILLTPIIIAGISNTIVSGTMRFSKIRNDNATIYISNKYSSVIKDNGFIAEKNNSVKGYEKYSGVNVLASAFGSEDVIEFTSDHRSIRLQIPRDEIYRIR